MRQLFSFISPIWLNSGFIHFWCVTGVNERALSLGVLFHAYFPQREERWSDSCLGYQCLPLGLVGDGVSCENIGLLPDTWHLVMKEEICLLHMPLLFPFLCRECSGEKTKGYSPQK